MVVHRSRQILIIHPGALGDVLQAIPALAALGELGEGSHLTFAGQTRLGRLLSGIGLVDEAIPFDGLGLENLFAHDSLPPQVESRLARFDRVISWFGARAEPFPQRLHSVVPAALIAPPIPETGPPPTVWEHLVRTLAPWGVTAPTRLAVLSLPQAWRAEARLTLSRLGWDPRRPLLAVHPGAGALWKQWPTESLARVIRRVALESGCQVLVHQGPADRDAVEGLFRALDQPMLHLVGPMLHLVGPPLHLLAAVLQEAAAYLGGDSGVSHLAAAVGTPAVILFPDATRDRWVPWSHTALPLAMTRSLHETDIIARAVNERLVGGARSHLASPDAPPLAAEEGKEEAFDGVVG